ncbi:MAG: undecaprenyl-diphosphate phosphatase, partial [Chloroflexia bacterium]
MGTGEAFLLGIVQGLTEFLPISSSGHLVLLPAWLHRPPPPLVFDTTVHLGTLVAVLAVFWREVGTLALAWWRG